MPIFEKDGQRVYFAHIPKTAGSAVYLMFLRSGWAISNVTTKPVKGRIGLILWDEFGINPVPQQGGRHGYAYALQHAPAEIWQHWGPFDSSFAISRDPYARFESALRFRYSKKRVRLRGFAHFRKRLLPQLNRARAAGTLPAYFRPQVAYLAPGTRVFRFERDWAAELAAAYGLTEARVERVNPTRMAASGLTDAEKAFVRDTYGEDFARFGYASNPP